MAESTPASRSVRPMLGWLSVGIAAAVFALVVGALVPGLGEIRFQSPSSGSGAGAIAGGARPWLVYTLAALVVAGVAAAVAGMVRGERRRWVHVAGVTLNVIAPIAAVLTTRLFLTAAL